MKDHGRGRWGWYHAGAEEPGMAAGASGWRSGRTQETTHNDVPKKGCWEWDHAGAEEPAWRTQETTHDDVLKKLDWLYQEHGSMKKKMAHMEEQMDHQKRETGARKLGGSSTGAHTGAAEPGGNTRSGRAGKLEQRRLHWCCRASW